MITHDKSVAENLLTLVRRHPSIIQSAQSMGVNRQQLTKYLSGSVLPSIPTLRKILDRYGIPLEEIFTDPKEFEKRWQSPPVLSGFPPRIYAAFSDILSNITNNQPILSRFVGHYHGYIRLRANPQKIARVHMTIGQTGVFTILKIIGYALPPGEGAAPRRPIKLDGLVQWIGGRLYLADVKDVNLSSGRIQSMILYPPIALISPYMHGLLMTTNDARNRPIFSSPVSFKKLPEQALSKHKLREVGVFHEDDPRLDAFAIGLLDKKPS